MDALKRVWARADGAGFHWISVWDPNLHFKPEPRRAANGWNTLEKPSGLVR
jgi:hypothetical protein